MDKLTVALNVTEEPLIVSAGTMPWFGFNMTNDGPSDVLVRVNPEKSMNSHRVRNSEPYREHMGQPVIKSIMLQCEPGRSATVRLVGAR